MNGRYGKNEWKIKFLYIFCVVLLLAVLVGGSVAAYTWIKPVYDEVQEEKALREEEERIEEEKRLKELKKMQEEAETEITKEPETELETEPETAKQTETDRQTEKQTESEKGVAEDNNYIIAESDQKYLSEGDVRGLSLKEINYAKNEIYARRGRRFLSWELQNYFDSQSWYSGTIDPDSFNDSVFNKYEKANAKFLSDTEYSMDSRGYQLDK